MAVSLMVIFNVMVMFFSVDTATWQMSPADKFLLAWLCNLHGYAISPLEM